MSYHNEESEITTSTNSPHMLLKLEQFTTAVKETASKSSPTSVALTIVGILLFSIPAAYLSWRWNKGLGLHFIVKIIYAFFAFMFGLFYLLFFVLIARSGETLPPRVRYAVKQRQ